MTARLFISSFLAFCLVSGPVALGQWSKPAPGRRLAQKKISMGISVTIPSESLSLQGGELASVPDNEKKLVLKIPFSILREEKKPSIPLIIAFKSDRTEIKQGEGLKVSWYTKDAKAVEVRCDDGVFFSKESLSNQIAQGGLVLKPKTSTTCTLFAHKNGEVDQQHVDVLVEGQPLPEKLKDFVEIDLNCVGPCKIEGEKGQEKIIVKVSSQKEAMGVLVSIPELGKLVKAVEKENLLVKDSLKKEYEMFKTEVGAFQTALLISDEAEAFNQYLDSKQVAQVTTQITQGAPIKGRGTPTRGAQEIKPMQMRSIKDKVLPGLPLFGSPAITQGQIEGLSLEGIPRTQAPLQPTSPEIHQRLLNAPARPLSVTRRSEFYSSHPWIQASLGSNLDNLAFPQLAFGSTRLNVAKEGGGKFGILSVNGAWFGGRQPRASMVNDLSSRGDPSGILAPSPLEVATSIQGIRFQLAVLEIEPAAGELGEYQLELIFNSGERRLVVNFEKECPSWQRRELSQGAIVKYCPWRRVALPVSLQNLNKLEWILKSTRRVTSAITMRAIGIDAIEVIP